MLISNKGRLIVIIAVYLIAAAVVVCGCLFIMKARSRD
jgi:flagellar basal body-associated protein FliL